MTSALVGNATPGVLTGVPSGTVNLLLYTGNSPVPPPPPTPPAASFTRSCSGRTCNFTNTSTNTSSNPNDPTTYTWNFGDGSPVVTGTDASHTFPSFNHRSYTVSLTATDTRGSTTASQRLTCNRNHCS